MAVTLSFTPNFVEAPSSISVVGRKLYICEAGTTTLASIYADEALSTPITNPLTSDAVGNFSHYYIAAGTYKLRLEDSSSTGIGTGILIREEDNVDTGVGTGGVVPVASGGTGATSAASARTNLGAAAQTDVDDLATDIADLQSSLQNVVSVPQGRLTLTSGAPVINADVSAGTAVYYTPYIGNLIPIWNGTQHIVFQFSELTLDLDSNHVASTLYDVFATLDDGEPILVTGPAWNTSTAGSGARGTGAATTELERKGGLYVNKVSMTGRNGATTYSVDANKATYLGTIRIDGTNGQISCHVSYGQSRRWGVWNAYNRKIIRLKAGTSTASWTYSTATWRPSNDEATNSITIVAGLAEEAVLARYIQNAVAANTVAATRINSVGVGWNSTTAPSGKVGATRLSNTSALENIRVATDLVAEYQPPPAIGAQAITALEINPDAAGSFSLQGTETGMLLTVELWG